MAPLALDIGPSELLIILAVVLVLFGGSRLAGLGKSAGRAIKEFKDETGALTDEPAAAPASTTPPPTTPASTTSASTTTAATAADQSADAGPQPAR